MRGDKEFDIPFSVIKAINLNADPTLRVIYHIKYILCNHCLKISCLGFHFINLQNPVFAEKNKTFFPCFLLCCFTSSPLKITARAPVGGYVPGQVINLEFQVNNKSDQNVTEFTVKLIKVSAKYIK